jgi:tRNA (guanine37-N1)-methyltransferase
MTRAYDLLGNIAIVKFSRETKEKEKKKTAEKILKENKGIKTVLEKIGKFKGRLRKQETKFLLGFRTKEVLYKENNCVFRFNVDSTYFSPRLSNERKEIASKIKKNEEVLVMFAGVAPFSIVIAKNSKAKKIVSVEINREASKYAKLNVELNKVKDRVEIAQSDVKKFAEKICKGRLSEGNRRCPRFDVIVMARPQLKESFLKEAFKLSKKGTRIFYYDFTLVSEKEKIVDKIKNEAKKAKKKIKILKIKHAGEVGKNKVRLRVDFVVL